jgi:hypothetical protein
MNVRKFQRNTISELITAIELEPDPVKKMAYIWANRIHPDLFPVLKLLYDTSYAIEAYDVKPRRTKVTAISERLGRSIEKIHHGTTYNLMTPIQKYNLISKYIEGFSAENENLFRSLLRNEVELDIPLADIRRAFPEIPDVQPALEREDIDEENASVVEVSSRSTPVNVITGNTGSFQFITPAGRALILPNKPKSIFRDYFSPARNMVFQAHLFGLNKRKTKPLKTNENIMEMFTTGKWDDEGEAFEFEIFDAVPLDQFKFAAEPRFNFFERRAWLQNYNKDNEFKWISLAPMVSYQNVEGNKHFVYNNESFWKDGYYAM